MTKLKSHGLMLSKVLTHYVVMLYLFLKVPQMVSQSAFVHTHTSITMRFIAVPLDDLLRNISNLLDTFLDLDSGLLLTWSCSNLVQGICEAANQCR